MTALCNKLAKFEGARERIYAADLAPLSECKAKLQKWTSACLNMKQALRLTYVPFIRYGSSPPISNDAEQFESAMAKQTLSR